MTSTPKRHKPRRDRDREQVDTVRCSAAVIVDSPYFAIGVADLRAGAPPRFDEMRDEYWGYERSRQWAVNEPKPSDFVEKCKTLARQGGRPRSRLTWFLSRPHARLSAIENPRISLRRR
jgi:hypothetical protein